MNRRILTSLFMLFAVSSSILAGDDWGQFARYENANRQLLSDSTAQAPDVVFMGNSITDVWANRHPDFFKRNNFIGRGISGQTSYQMLLRFRDDVISLHPKLVVINCGINDIAENNHNYNEDRTFGNIVSMAELAKANGIGVILTSVLPAKSIHWRQTIENTPEKIISLNDRIRKYTEENGLSYVDYYQAMVTDDQALKPEYARDNVHPNLEGYDVMESIVLPVISSNLGTIIE